MVNIYTNKCTTCGKLIPANLPMNGTCVTCYWRDTYRKEEQRNPANVLAFRHGGNYGS